MMRRPACLIRIFIPLVFSFAVNGAVAQESVLALEKALEESGWAVHRDPDGNLLLAPVERSGPEQAAPKTAIADQWPELASKLQSAGWLVEHEADGSLRLVSPGTEAKQKSAEDTKEPANAFQSSSDRMQRQLRDAGWKVTRSSDDSLLLYPPGYSGFGKPEPCPGVPTSVAVSLPVDNWQDAHDIAQGWLRIQEPFNAAVGKIRKILNVYLVSIVSSKPPYNLIQQIAIRNSDGSVIVLN